MIENIFDKRAELFTKFANQANDYFKKMENVVRSYHPEDHKQFLADIDWLKKEAKSLLAIIHDIKSKPMNIDTITTYLELYNTLGIVDNKLNFILSVLTNEFYNQGIFYDKSMTYTYEIEAERKKVLALHDKYIADKRGDDLIVFQLISDKAGLISGGLHIPSMGNEPKKVERDISLDLQLKELIIKRHFTNDLAIYLSNIIINTVYMRPAIENFKNDSMQVPPPLSALMFYRHGLFPITDSMSLDNLMKYLRLDYDPKKSIKQINAVGKGVVLLHKVVKNPVRYNILPLISQHYIEKNNLSTSPTSGINARVIRRFNTITTLALPDKIPPQWTIEKYDEDNGVPYSECYVIETFNDKQYHLLSNKFDRPFVRDRTVAEVGRTARRPQVYNEIMSERIFKHILPNYKQDLYDFDKSKLEWFSTETFKENVKRDMQKKFEEKMSLIGPKNYLDIFTDRTIGSGVIGKLLYKDLLPNTKRGEFHVTYLKNVDNLITKYNMALSGELAKVSVPESYFVEKSPDDMRKFLTSTYMSMIDKVLAELDASLWIDIGASLKLFMMHKLLIKI